MSKTKLTIVIIGFIVIALAAPALWIGGAGQKFKKFFDPNEPDLPAKAGMDKEDIDKGEYLRMRQEQIDYYTGADTAKQDSRINAIRELEQVEADMKRRGDAPTAPWVPLGPAPIPIGATNGWSGRTSAIAVHPTDPNTVYVGTAQGGLYRTLDGGTTWTAIMDSAASLAIGAVAISPSDPTTVYVGTGESTQCGSGCYIGVGVYRINNANTAPVLTGPLNSNGVADIFTGRAISEILVHPTDSNTIFVGTTSGIAGIGATTSGLALPPQGIYRSTNAAGPTPTFAQVPIVIPTGTLSNRNVTDLYMDPVDPNRIWAGVIGAAAGDGGVYTTANALAASPTFTQALSITLTGAQSRVELAGNNVAGTTTVYAATGEGTGTTYKSVAAAPFTLVLDNNFCNPQCFYDIAIAVDPTNANNVYLGGSPQLVFGKSTTGGASYTSSSTGLHVDTQAIAVAPSNPAIVYFGSDGGIWKTSNVAATPVVWTTLNNTTYSATQFESIAIHPNDVNYSLGGTQDNGTEYLGTNGTTWINSDGGDGGFVVIDQTSLTPTTTTAYHTYFNQTNTQIGFSRATTTQPDGDPNWGGLFGCGGTANGISCTDAVLFYAPMVGGPVAPDSALKNTLYFGTNKLYRSANLGTLMTPVSQVVGTVSAIGIASQDDAIRLIGSTGGRVFYSNTAGATTMTDITGTIPARYVARIVISPFDANIAYVALNGFGIPNQHVMKTTNLNAPTPTWTNAGVGIPDVPVNALVHDPASPTIIYAGTDIGVFWSGNSGATWQPFGTGLPRVAVFGMAIQNTARVLRIATHGKGMWQTPIGAPTAADVSISGRVFGSEDGRGLTNARVSLTSPDGTTRVVITGRLGAFRFDDVPSGATYTVAVASRRFTFEPRTITVSDSIGDLNFYPEVSRNGRR